MGLKCIKFTNGTVLPIYADVLGGVQPWDDTIIVGNNPIMSTTLNAYVCAADPINGGFLNANINGTTLTDYDGNVWDFTLTDSNTLKITITDPNENTSEFILPAFNNTQPCFYLAVCSDYNNGDYTISFRQAYPLSINQRQIGEQYLSKYIRTGYANGFNNYSGTYFQDDIRLVRAGEGYSRTVMRNIIPGDTFCHAIHLWLWETTELTQSAYFWYGYPLTRVPVSGSFTLSSDSIDDVPTNSEDPYGEGGTTGPGGGSGDLDDTSDDIEIPSLPTLDATDTGFITLFNPTLQELQNLASYMWSGLFDVATFKKIFADPMDCILGLSIVPVAIPNGSSVPVKVGNISTGVNMTKAGKQYIEVDCGSINVNEYWGAYLDYDPFTKAEIYLPYIGAHPIAVDDIMGKTVTVKYHIDILSGACTAFVKCGGSVLYSFIGQCSSSIPISGNDWTNVVNGAVSIAAAIGSMVATEGATIPAVVSQGAGMASTALTHSKPSIEKSGSMSGTGGMLAVQTPYLIITRPKQAVPGGQNRFTGYPAFITTPLSAITGYTEVESIHLEGIPGTQEEYLEIESLLKGGVIL